MGLNKYNANDDGLEEAKNFAFIWSLFENQSSKSIFSDKMKFSEFQLWVNNLEIKQGTFGLIIKDQKT